MSLSVGANGGAYNRDVYVAWARATASSHHGVSPSGDLLAVLVRTRMRP